MKDVIKNYFLLIVLIFFICMSDITADLKDYSSGGSGSAGNMSGSGTWTATYSGLKIGIIDKYNNLEDVEIILDNNLPSTMYFSYNNNPKMFQPSKITWEKQNTNNYLSTSLVPDSWYDTTNNNTFINLHEYLSKNNYKNLISILGLKNKNNGTPLFNTLSPGDYIVIEPMTYIGGYFGTAYELANSFLTLTDSCYNEGNFCWNYSGLVFGGINSIKNTSRRCGGIFHKIIYLSESVPMLGLTVLEDSDGCKATSNSVFKSRNNCLKSSTCGRGIGVFEYNNLFSGSIEITKYKTGTTNPISGAGFTLYSNSNCTRELVSQIFTNENGKVTFSNLNTGTYYYKETFVPTDYTGDISCKSINISNGSKSTAIMYNTENPKTGDLNINIKIKETNNLITSSNATFEIYSGSNCTGTLINTVSTSMGSLTTNLNAGTYSIKEKIAPSGYVKSNPVCVKSSTIVKAGDKTTEDIFYEPTCTTELENLGDYPTIQQLFALYKKYPSKRNLLNLSNPSCTPSACSDNKLSLGCLSGTTNPSIFNETNLSCYTGDPLTDNYGNYIGFCQNSYNLVNNIGTNKFYAKAGRLLITQNENTITIFEKNDLNELIKKNISSDSIASSTTTRICYSLNNLNVSNINVLPEYSVYFGDNNNDKSADFLQNIDNQDQVYHDITTNNLNKYTISNIKKYTLNTVYLEKISGKYSNTKTNSTISEPIYGLLSRFDVESGVIPFKVNSISSNSCTFGTKQEIFKEKLKLEFRSIDTKEPFNRNTMSNWSDNTDNSRDNDVVKKYIKDAVNSYGLDKYGNKVNHPLYKITLTPNDIKIIRKYNNGDEEYEPHPYDNYLTEEVLYKGNKIIRNSFLYNLENGKLNNKNLNNKLYNSKYPN